VPGRCVAVAGVAETDDQDAVAVLLALACFAAAAKE